jgi:lactate racemase
MRVNMRSAKIKIANQTIDVIIPESTKIFSVLVPEVLADPVAAIEQALEESIASPNLSEIVTSKMRSKPDCRAVIVISDNTRPVPYKGSAGILWPVLKKLLEAQIPKEKILILISNGTHRPLQDSELKEMLDPRIFELGIPIENHDCHDRANLTYLGKTSRDTEIYINSHYMEADIKILTGLVESHFMAGVSGGRKSICPGLVGEDSTFVFHSAKFLASPKAFDSNLTGNPCHEEALEVAEKAGADYIVNVTLDHELNLSGVFAGDLTKAHESAAEKTKKSSTIPIENEFDIVITHAGFVGINHYQAAKAAVGVIPALKPGGILIEVANNIDFDPIGSANYRTLIHLLKLLGTAKFNQLLFSPDWSFIPEQWQVQMWGKLFSKIPQQNFIYYSPQLSTADYKIIPGMDGNLYLPEEERYHGTVDTIPRVLELALKKAITDFQMSVSRMPTVAFFVNGPYGVPVRADL